LNCSIITMDQINKINQIKRVILISGIFTALVSLLMMLNYMQIRGSEPLESKTLNVLVEKLSAEPGNQELIDEIRQFDLLARKAYFSSLWQIRTGAWLLLIGGIVLVIALRSYHNLRFSIAPPDDSKPGERKSRMLAQRWIGIAGILVFLLAGLSAFLSADHLKQFETVQAALTENQPDDGIERIRITTNVVEEPAVVDTTNDVAENISEIEEETQTESDVDLARQVNESAAPVALTASLVNQNYTSFRGAFGNAVSTHRNIPTDWDGSTGKNILWKVEIPVHGYNSPIIWGDRLYFSGANTSKRVVYCMDRHTGKIIWEQEVNNIPGSPATPPKTTEDTGLAAPSLTTDGNSVFALFGTGDIIAFDMDGNRKWARNLGVPKNHYGHSSSLLTWDNKVFVQYDTQAGSKVMALNASTGQTTWETARTSDVSWASPILANVNGQYQLIVLGNPDFSGYDTKTGRELWNVKCMSGEVGVSPVYGGGLVFAANEYATMIAVNPSTGEKVWEDRYYLPEVSSPAYHDGLLYIGTTFAVLASFEAATGKFVWEFDADDSFYSSPILADGKLYIFDTTGKAYIFKPDREPELIASPELGERVYSTPAFANGRIYIRGNKHLYCIGTN
jgi:outer membrane protein assembly factor BamB